jgi:glycosyltransferase involved in cell wall biosynthesis
VENEVTVSCVIPAYNEAGRIGALLDVVAGHELVSQVIVVDDGSTDGTGAVAARPGVELVSLSPNGGKTNAVRAGAAIAGGSHIMLLDADLQGVTRADLAQLLAPVRSGAADATISLRGNSPLAWRLIGIDYISGERVLPAPLLRSALQAGAGLALEVHLNRWWLDNGLRLSVVRWPAVASPAKSVKFGFVEGMKRDIAMLRDMFGIITLREACSQILRMRSRAVAIR